jgi:hypothetical protein
MKTSKDRENYLISFLFKAQRKKKEQKDRHEDSYNEVQEYVYTPIGLPLESLSPLTFD